MSLIPLYSRHMKIVKPIYKYGAYTEGDNLDIVCAVTFENFIQVYVVDKYKFKLQKTVNLNYLHKTRSEIFKYFNDIDTINIENISGMWRENEKGQLQFTLWIIFTDTLNRVYIIQTDIFDWNGSETNVIFYPEISRFKDYHFGITIKENFIYSDTKNIDTYDVYLMYIENGKESIKGKPVKGRRILVTKEEKDNFINNNLQFAEFIDYDYPCIDIWNKPEVLYVLPDDIEKVKFQFSNGLAFVRFTNEQHKEYEKFKI